MPKQRIIILAVAVLLGIVALFMVKAYLDQREQAIIASANKALETAKEEKISNQVTVFVAKQNIPSGATISSNMLDPKIASTQQVKPSVIVSLDKIVGMTAMVNIAKNELITADKLSAPGKESQQTGLSQLTPPGKRAITINVDNISGLVGMIKPGDYVDVLTTLPLPVKTPDGKQATQVVTLPLFQNISVLAVGQEIGTTIAQDERYKKKETSAKAEAAPLITLALSPQEASLLAFAQEQGKIRLVLRSPVDSKTQPIQPATWDTFFQYITPPEQLEKEAKAKQQQGPTVEIYRGLNKEQVPLTR